MTSQGLDLNLINEMLNKEDKADKYAKLMELNIKRELKQIDQDKRLFVIEDEVDQDIRTGSEAPLPSDTELDAMKSLYNEIDMLRTENDNLIVAIQTLRKEHESNLEKIKLIKSMSLWQRVKFVFTKRV